MKTFSEKEKWASKGKKWLTSPCLLTESSTEANIIKSVIINVAFFFNQTLLSELWLDQSFDSTINH